MVGSSNAPAAVMCLPAPRPHWATGRVLLRDMRRIELVDARPPEQVTARAYLHPDVPTHCARAVRTQVCLFDLPRDVLLYK